MLSGMSRGAGVVLAAKQDVRVKHVEFVRIEPTRALAIMVAENGGVENRIIDLEPGLPSSALVEAANYLNAHFRGHTLSQARGELQRQREERRREIDKLTERVIAAGVATWGGTSDDPGTLIVRGMSNLIGDVKALEDLERIRLLFDDLESKKEIIQLLGRRRAGGRRAHLHRLGEQAVLALRLVAGGGAVPRHRRQGGRRARRHRSHPAELRPRRAGGELYGPAHGAVAGALTPPRLELAAEMSISGPAHCPLIERTARDMMNDTDQRATTSPDGLEAANDQEPRKAADANAASPGASIGASAGADTAAAPADETAGWDAAIEQLEGSSAEIERLESEKSDLTDRLLRVVADMDNLRRRTERELADARKYAVQKFAADMLVVGDNLKRALQAIPSERKQEDEAFAALVEGVEMTQREMDRLLERNGISQIAAEGERFDPNRHQAMFEVPDSSVAAGTVVQVVQDGFVIGDRVLRAAMVGVSTGGPKPGEAAEKAPAEG